MKILKDLGMEPEYLGSKTRRRFYIVECPVCKSPYKTQARYIENKSSTKCKSCARKISMTKHGDAKDKTRLYVIWANMIARCGKHENYINIQVCKEWKDYANFKKWSLTNGYTDDLTIDRKNPDGDYNESNCRWVSIIVQAQNKKKSKNNTSGFKGVSKISSGKYLARIQANKTRKTLGTFDTALEASKAYDEYIIKNKLEHNTNKELNYEA